MSASFVKELGTWRYHNNGTDTTNTRSFTITLGATAPHLVILHLVNTNYDATAVADSRGNTWTKGKNIAGAMATSQWFTKQDVAALQAGDTITITFAGSISTAVAKVEEYQGLVASPKDQTASATWTASTNRNSGTTPVTTQADELVVGTFGNNVKDTVFTPGTGYSSDGTGIVSDPQNLRSIESVYLVVSATGTYAPTGTGDVSGNGTGVTVTYKASAGSIIPSTTVSATSTVSGSLRAKRAVAGNISATSTVSGAVTKRGQVGSVASTYGVGVYGTAVFGGSAGAPTGIAGNVLATSTVSGGVTRIPASGPTPPPYTPPYTPPTPPPSGEVFEPGSFAQAVYDQLNVDQLLS